MSPATTKQATELSTTKKLFFAFATYVGQEPLPPPHSHTPCQPHTRVPQPAHHCRLSAFLTLHVAVGASVAVALVVAVVNFIYHLTFFTVFMLPKGVSGGGARYSQRHTLSDF